MHSIFVHLVHVQKNIEQEIRYTWLLISKMYNEEAEKFGGSMTIGFAL